jgi:hypothetical protein
MPAKGKARKQRKWGKSDNKALNEAVNDTQLWQAVVAKLKNRFTVAQCQAQYRLILNPNVIEESRPWLTDEDNLLEFLSMKSEMMGNWSQILLFFPHRTEQGLKERYAWLRRRNRDMVEVIRRKPVKRQVQEQEIQSEGGQEEEEEQGERLGEEEERLEIRAEEEEEEGQGINEESEAVEEDRRSALEEEEEE